MHPLEKYRTALAANLEVSPDRIALFQKGRVGLYAILRSLGIGEGDEVIVPAFTCVVVPNAIIYAGAKPVYVDVDPQTYNMDPACIEAKITSHTRLILAQNTFGLAPDLDRIFDLVKDRPIQVVEDCTHGFGGFYKGQKNGTIAVASFFSTQWNKPFSTGIGGFTVARTDELAQALRALEASYPPPPFLTRKVLQAQLFARRWFMPDFLYWPLLKFYRYLSKQGIVTGSSTGMELVSTQMPQDYLRALSSEQSQAGLKALAQLPLSLKHQHKIAKIYEASLQAMGVSPVFQPDYATHTFLKYPLLVQDRAWFMGQAERRRIPLGDWMLSPIHPVREGFEKWHYALGANPHGERLAAQVVNLPTDRTISEAKAVEIVRFLQENADQLVGRDI